MPLNVSGGPLAFEASLQTDDLISGSKKVEATLQKIAATAVETSKRQSQAMVDAANVAAKRIDQINKNPFSAAPINPAIKQGAEETAEAIETLGNATEGASKKTQLLGGASQALNAAQNLQIVSTEGAAAAQQALNVALDSNPIGAVVLAVQAIIAAFAFYSNQLEDAKEKQKEMNEALAQANELFVQLVKLQNSINADQTKAAENAVSLAQAQGKSENEIYRLKLKALEARKNENGIILETLQSNSEDLGYYRAKVESLRQSELSLIRLKAQLGELTDFDEQRLVVIQAQTKAYTSLLNAAQAAADAIKSADAEAANLRAEQAKKAHDNALKSSVAEAEARVLLAKKNTRQELELQIAAIKAKARADLDNVNLTSGERKRILADEQASIIAAQKQFNLLQLNNQRELINASLAGVEEGSRRELELKIDLINKNAQIERAQIGVTAERRKAIDAETAKAISDLTAKYAFKGQEEEISIAIANSNKKIAIAEDGSIEELKLKKDLVDQKAALDIISAQSQIKNQQLLVAKIKEINAKAQADQKKLDDDYYDKQLKTQLKAIEIANEKSKVSLDRIIKDPNSSDSQRADAERVKLESDFIAINQQMDIVEENIRKNRGNVANLKLELATLQLKAEKIVGEMGVSESTATVKNLKNIAKLFDNASHGLGSLADSLSGVNDELAETIRVLSKISASVSDAIKSFKDLKKDGNSTGENIAAGLGIVGAAVGVVTAIVGIFRKAREERKKLEQEEQQRLLNIVTGEIQINEKYRERLALQGSINRLRLDGIRAEASALKKNQESNLADYQRILALIQNEQIKTGTRQQTYLFGVLSRTVPVFESLAGKSFEDLEKLFFTGQLEGKAKDLFQTLQSLKEEGVNIDQQLEELKAKTQETFTGTTADSILDSIVQAFADGKRATADFADNFEDLMKGAILNSLKFQALEKPLKDFYDKFADFSQSDGTLTQSEITKLQTLYDTIISNAGSQFEQLQKLTKIDFSSAGNQNSLKGSISAQLTEQTGTVLAGSFNGLRLTSIEIMQISTRQLNVLNMIQNNTAMIADTNAYLRKFDTLGIKVR